jgi:ribonuclease P protein component
VLTAAARLRRRDEFAATIKGGRRASRGGVVVHLRANADTKNADTKSTDAKRTDTKNTDTDMNPARDGTPPPRAGFVVSKAVGGAVVRNKVKRRLRHLMVDQLGTLPPATDVVVRALPSAATRTFAELRTDLDAALLAAARPRHRTAP